MMFSVKIRIFLRALVVLAIVSTATATVKIPSRRMLVSAIRRQLNLDECIVEAETLYIANPNLQAAFESYEADITSAVESCGQDSLTCTIDQNTFASARPFINACEEADGEIWEYDFAVQVRRIEQRRIE